MPDVAIVTGGAQGIGAATVRALCERGLSVLALDIDEQRGHQLARELGARAAFRRCDVTDEEDVAAAAAHAREALGSVTVLVNNAGVNAAFDPTEMSIQQWDAFFALDLRAAWLCTRAVLPDMRTHQRGAIVNVASIHARLTHPGAFPYAAAKAGMLGLTRSLAVEEGHHGIRVNAVSPGYTRTRLVTEAFSREADPASAERSVAGRHPLRRIGEPDEVASVIAFLASDDASYVTGAELAVDGGLGVRFA